MNAPAVIAESSALGINLSAIGERLIVDAPVGILTPELRSGLATHKGEIVRLLRLPALQALREGLDDGDELPEPVEPARFEAERPERRPFVGVAWRCRAPGCLHKGRWWMSRWGVVSCYGHCPPADPSLVVSQGDESDVPQVDPERSHQAVNWSPAS